MKPWISVPSRLRTEIGSTGASRTLASQSVFCRVIARSSAPSTAESSAGDDVLLHATAIRPSRPSE